MNVGVIGGSGFIGSHVVDKLIDAGHEVTVFDIMKPHRGDVRFMNIDITDLSKTTVVLAGNYDAIYLLAAMANVNDVFNNPVESAQVNIMGVANVIEAIRRNRIPRLIYSSTVWVYDAVLETEVNESQPIIVDKVNHIYTASKIAAEMYIQSYNQLYGVDHTILRYGIPYGPRARGGTVIAIFVDKALKADPITIHGDGSQYRNFIYVEDLAEGNVAALNEIAINKTYNLDGKRPITIKEVAETVKTIFNDKVEIQYEPDPRPGDYKGKKVSNQKSKDELGWEPLIDLEEGIERYIKWYKSIHKL